MLKFTGIFVSAVVTCDKFLCCYYETCRCRKAGPVQNPVGFHSENSMNWTSNDQISIPGRQENRLEALRTFKKKCGCIFKRSLVNRFQTKENVFWYSGTRLGRTWKPRDLRQLRLVWRCRRCITTSNWSSGTKLERAVSPECNQNVDSKRNLKNEGKKLERQPLQRLQLCRWRLDKRRGKIIFLRWICWTTERTIPRKRKHFRKRWSYDNWQGLRKY